MRVATAVMALGVEYDAKRAERLRASVAGIDGVDFADFNYTNNKLAVKFDPDRVNLEKLQGIVARERKHQDRSADWRRNARGTGG